MIHATPVYIRYEPELMHDQLPYQIALTLLPHTGPVWARTLLDTFGNAEAIFKCSFRELKKMEGISDARMYAIKHFNQMHLAEKEASYIVKNKITTLFLTDANYPKRLLQCPDAPILLYQLGDVNLNKPKVLSIIGTRKNTEYGKRIVAQLIDALAQQDILIVSGLAFGIDALAHQGALKHQLATVGVLAHGFNSMYPAQHRGLAREMVESGGGLLTEFRSEELPDKFHFPSRNRIVAGLCDGLIVVETGTKGGSLITADLANGYNRDVFAFPGRIFDSQSEGCLQLIKENKACLIQHAGDILEALNWVDSPRRKSNSQIALFHDLSEPEQKIVALLQNSNGMAIDEINWQSGISVSAVAAAILSLELKNLIVNLPGKLYRLS